MDTIIYIVLFMALVFFWLCYSALSANSKIHQNAQQIDELNAHIDNLLKIVHKLRSGQHTINGKLDKQLSDMDFNLRENTLYIKSHMDSHDTENHESVLEDDLNSKLDVDLYNNNNAVNNLLMSKSLNTDLEKGSTETNQLNTNAHAHNINNNGLTSQIFSNKPKLPNKPNPSNALKPVFEEPSFVEKAFEFAKTWLTTGNIPVKVGMLVVISAVIALLRYATTMGLLKVPIEFKLLGVAGIALGALAFAWSKRHSKRSFSLVVQGGSIGIVLLTVFSAVKMYALMSTNVGFLLSVIMVVLTTILSIKQDAKMLALIAIFAGFLAPIWLSDGTGSHVVLFSYYAILNLGIFVITWYKPWHEMSVLGFIFTYVIGSTWGGLKYQPENFSSIEPFIVLFFLFYLYIPLHHAIRSEKQINNKDVDNKIELENSTENCVSTKEITDDDSVYNKYRLRSMLLFGTPMVTFGIHSQLLTTDKQLAISCVIMGLVYAVLAITFRNSSSTVLSTLQKAYMGISASLFTFAIPIGLSAKATTTIYAIEGVGGVWLGARANPKERSMLTWLAGGGLQFFSMVAFIQAYASYGLTDTHTTVFNEMYFSALVMAVSGFLCSWFSYQAVKNNPHKNNSLVDSWLGDETLTSVARALFIWAIIWWLGINLFEIARFFNDISDTGIETVYGWLVLISLTCAILPLVYNHSKGYKDSVVWVVSSLLMMSSALFSLWQIVLSQSSENIPFVLAISSLLIYTLVGIWLWRSYKAIKSKLINITITIWLLSVATTISSLVYSMLLVGFNGIYHNNITQIGWCLAMICSVWVAMTLSDIYRPQTFLALVQGRRVQGTQLNTDNTDSESSSNHWQIIMSYVSIAILGLLFIYLFSLSGDGGNLVNSETQTGIWLPILNSVDALQIGLMGVCALWLKGNIGRGGKRIELFNQSKRALLVSIMIFCIINIITLRFIYHNQLGMSDNQAIEWSFIIFREAIVQMTLTLIWSVLGVIAWIIGSRRMSKSIWLVGAVLMIVVLIKLLLIDRVHLGNIYGIVSCLTYGLLCTIVGYFAPIPDMNDGNKKEE